MWSVRDSKGRKGKEREREDKREKEEEEEREKESRERKRKRRGERRRGKKEKEKRRKEPRLQGSTILVSLHSTGGAWINQAAPRTWCARTRCQPYFASAGPFTKTEV